MNIQTISNYPTAGIIGFIFAGMGFLLNYLTTVGVLPYPGFIHEVQNTLG